VEEEEEKEEEEEEEEKEEEGGGGGGGGGGDEEEEGEGGGRGGGGGEEEEEEEDTVRICKSNRCNGNYGCVSCLMFNGRHTRKSQVPHYITIHSTNVLLETAVFSNNLCKILQNDNLTFNSNNLDCCYN
jgi:hypothetical protein